MDGHQPGIGAKLRRSKLIVALFIFVLLNILSTVSSVAIRDRGNRRRRGHLSEKVREGALRLVDGGTEFMGRLEIHHGGSWGTICDDDFEDFEAWVACTELGYRGGELVHSHNVEPGEGIIWLDNIECPSTLLSTYYICVAQQFEGHLCPPEVRVRLSECRHHGWSVHDCTHTEDVILRCLPPEDEGSGGGSGDDDEDGDVTDDVDMETSMADVPLRLAEGSKPLAGRIEIYYNDEWGTVCDDGFDVTHAHRVCAALGLGGGRIVTVGEGSGPIWVDEMKCPEDGSHELADCVHDGWGRHDCTHGEDIGIECDHPEGGIKEGVRLPGVMQPVRLVNGTTAHDGRLEVFHDGRWGTICDDKFNDRNAEKVCFELGYYGGKVEFKGKGNGDILMDEVVCTDDHTYLAQCQHSGWGTHDCTHDEDVGITCDERPTDNAPVGSLEGSLRLADGDESDAFEASGRLEIYHAGSWGTICDDKFSEKEATLACKQLGFTQGSIIPLISRGSGPIWMDEVSCSDEITELSQCSFSGWRIHDCSHGEDVSIKCEISGMDFPELDYPVRLYGVVSPNQGRVEISVDGVWGTVCDDSWTDANTRVVCRQLGFHQGGEVLREYSTGHLPIYMDEVSCLGTESQLSDCHFSGWGVHDCSHSEDVQLLCYLPEVTLPALVPADEGAVKLADQISYSTEVYGYVLVYHQGEWGTICDDGVGDTEASVICRQLGFQDGILTTHATQISGATSYKIWLDSLSCTSQADSVMSCYHDAWGEHDCSHAEDVRVACNH